MIRVEKALPEGPVDVIGDVHGEIDALMSLIEQLGYNRDAKHGQGRHLVLVGDLCDRGPDSPEVLKRVLSWVDAGRAHCVLGNHELNLLRSDRKAGNGWFFEHDHDRAKGRFENCAPVKESDRAQLLAALEALPLLLRREDLRIVHACWHEASINRLANLPPLPSWSKVYEMFETLIEHALSLNHRAQDVDLANARLSSLLDNEERFFEHAEFSRRDQELLDVLSDSYEQFQMGNPLRVLTSGVERSIAAPYYASHRWRLTERVRWWQDYRDVPVIVGHYWRARYTSTANIEGKPSLVETSDYWLGDARKVLCVDFSVGARNGSGLERCLNRGYLACWRSDSDSLSFDR